MKIVCISDTHNRHNQIVMPEGVVLIHAGDATGKGRSGELESFFKWFGAQDFALKIFVAGNHDLMFEDEPEKALAIMERYAPNVVYLQDESYVYGGIRFYGTPWQHEFHSWAFNASGEKLKERFSLIPNDTAVLISHSPPYDILDSFNGTLIGSSSLRKKVAEVNPLLHVFGHVHFSHGECYEQLTEGGPMIHFVNAAICDEDYHPTNSPIVVEI